MDYVIYKLTNLVTGKGYVGYTKDLKARLSSHKCCAGNCRLLHNSIRKHGWAQFSHEIIEHTTEDQALARETFFILKFNTLAPYGYNLVLEDTDRGRKFSLESNIERSTALYESHKGRIVTNKFIGVSVRANNTFYAHIAFRRKVYVKSFRDEIEAAEAYDRVVLYLRGANARINFIDNLEKYLSEDLKVFFENFCKKHIKSSKYPFVWWHKGHDQWTAAYKHADGTLKYIGLYNDEEDAYKAYLHYEATGEYTKKPARIPRESSKIAALKDGYLACIIRSPDGSLYKAASLKEFCKDFNFKYHNLTNSWAFKRPCARGSERGWQVIGKFTKTPEVKKHFQELDLAWYLCDKDSIDQTIVML